MANATLWMKLGLSTAAFDDGMNRAGNKLNAWDKQVQQISKKMEGGGVFGTFAAIRSAAAMGGLMVVSASLNRAMDEYSRVLERVAKGELSAAAGNEELAKTLGRNIPLFGGFVEFGEKYSETVFTNEAAQKAWFAALEKSNAELDKQIELRRRAIKEGEDEAYRVKKAASDVVIGSRADNIARGERLKIEQAGGDLDVFDKRVEYEKEINRLLEARHQLDRANDATGVRLADFEIYRLREQLGVELDILEARKNKSNLEQRTISGDNGLLSSIKAGLAEEEIANNQRAAMWDIMAKQMADDFAKQDIADKLAEKAGVGIAENMATKSGEFGVLASGRISLSAMGENVQVKQLNIQQQQLDVLKKIEGNAKKREIIGIDQIPKWQE